MGKGKKHLLNNKSREEKQRLELEEELSKVEIAPADLKNLSRDTAEKLSGQSKKIAEILGE